jgi:hypothetical protein
LIDFGIFAAASFFFVSKEIVQAPRFMFNAFKMPFRCSPALNLNDDVPTN